MILFLGYRTQKGNINGWPGTVECQAISCSYWAKVMWVIWYRVHCYHIVTPLMLRCLIAYVLELRHFFISYGLLCFACCYFAFVKSCVYFRYVLVSTYLNVTCHIGMRRFDMLQEQSLNNYDESSWLLRCRPHHDNIQYRLLIQNSESLSWGFRIKFCPSFPCGWWSGSLFSLVIPFCGPILCTNRIFFIICSAETWPVRPILYIHTHHIQIQHL